MRKGSAERPAHRSCRPRQGSIMSCLRSGYGLPGWVRSGTMEVAPVGIPLAVNARVELCRV